MTAFLHMSDDGSKGFGVFAVGGDPEDGRRVLREAMANLRTRYAHGNMSRESYCLRRDSFVNYLAYDRKRDGGGA